LKTAHTICVAAALLSGCFTTGPVDNLPFGEIDQLSDIDGVYENSGESGLAPLWLSQLIWPDAEDLNHDGIERIEVRAMDDVTVAVTATATNAAIVIHETFVEGEDFDFSNGAIQLHRRVEGAPLDPESPVLGIGYETVTLGLDQAGDGKYRSEGVFAGTLFVIIPVAIGGSDDVRFRRVAD